MTLTVLSQGAEAIAEDTWDLTVASTARLFAVDVYSGNTLAEVQALTEADLVEPSFTGYAAVSLGTWTPTGSGPTAFSHAAVTFTASADVDPGQTVHGWWIRRTSDGLAIALEVFTTGPFRFRRAGMALAVTPELTVG